MPTIVFNDEFVDTGGPITDRQLTVHLREVPTPNARWWIKYVSLYYNDADLEGVKWVDVRIPQLFANDKVVFSNHSVKTNPTLPASPLPSDSLRFYLTFQTWVGNAGFGDREGKVKTIALSPNLNLGRHTLYNSELSVIYSPVIGTDASFPNATKLKGFSIILEYEE